MPPTESAPVHEPVEEKPVEQAVEEEAPANDLPDEVLPPEDESTTPAKPTEGTAEGQEGAEEPERNPDRDPPDGRKGAGTLKRRKRRSDIGEELARSLPLLPEILIEE